MPSVTAESTTWEAEQSELQSVLRSPLFSRSPALTHLLSYLCEKTFAGEADQIKEYSVALDVFDRRDSFDQDTDSMVRVQANRLRKRLAEYYAREGVNHPIQITIPVGQYVPQFKHVRLEEAQPPDAIAPGADVHSLWFQRLSSPVSMNCTCTSPRHSSARKIPVEAAKVAGR